MSGAGTLSTTTSALEVFKAHLLAINGVREVVVDAVDPFLAPPAKLSTIYVDEVQATAVEHYTGSNNFQHLQWIVTVWTANKRETRLLLAKIANMYVNLNETDAGARFAELQAVGICGIEEVSGSRHLDLSGTVNFNHCGQTVMDTIYQETALPQ